MCWHNPFYCYCHLMVPLAAPMPQPYYGNYYTAGSNYNTGNVAYNNFDHQNNGNKRKNEGGHNSRNKRRKREEEEEVEKSEVEKKEQQKEAERKEKEIMDSEETWKSIAEVFKDRMFKLEKEVTDLKGELAKYKQQGAAKVIKKEPEE
ncbi:hypothetical protein PRZ48_000269 [Zasmidium cellare]|uniref:Uncharacterized protein n=1 Tax=Zasmidium cellare TaxID=395010 RepID=A0ABR0EYC2_ZASCE|nr:hypothetical protein PRZ48_000269 [Zasmidium cellare]